MLETSSKVRPKTLFRQSRATGIGTLPETNIAPENQWLEDEFPFGMAYFQVLC